MKVKNTKLVKVDLVRTFNLYVRQWILLGFVQNVNICNFYCTSVPVFET